MNNPYIMPTYMNMNYYPQYMFPQKPNMMPYQNYYIYPQNQGNTQNMAKQMYMPMYIPYNMNQTNTNYGYLKQPQKNTEKKTKDNK